MAVETILHPLFSLVAEIWQHRIASSMTAYFEDLRIVVTPLKSLDNNGQCALLKVVLDRVDFTEPHQKIRGQTTVTETLHISRKGWCNLQLAVRINIPSLPANTLTHTIEMLGFRLDQDTPLVADHHGQQRLDAITNLIRETTGWMSNDQVDRHTGYWSINTAGELIFSPGQKQ